jgi:hypothetical protein
MAAQSIEASNNGDKIIKRKFRERHHEIATLS